MWTTSASQNQQCISNIACGLQNRFYRRCRRKRSGELELQPKGTGVTGQL